GPGLGGGDAGLLERGAELGQGQVPLAAPALDQLVHVGRGCLIVVSLRHGGRVPRHETYLPLCACRARCSCTTGRRRGLAGARRTWYRAARALSSNARRGHLFPCRCRAPMGRPAGPCPHPPPLPPSLRPHEPAALPGRAYPTVATACPGPAAGLPEPRKPAAYPARARGCRPIAAVPV